MCTPWPFGHLWPAGYSVKQPVLLPRTGSVPPRGCRTFHEFAQREATSTIGRSLATEERLLFTVVTHNAELDALKEELQTSSHFQRGETISAAATVPHLNRESGEAVTRSPSADATALNSPRTKDIPEFPGCDHAAAVIVVLALWSSSEATH